MFNNSFVLDLKNSVNKFELASELAKSDIRVRYAHSKFGPFWETLSLAIFLVVLSIVWSKIMSKNLNEYLPYLVCGVVIWRYISFIVTGSCQIFITNNNLLKNFKLSISLIPLKHSIGGFFIFLHHSPLILLINIIWNNNFLSLNLLYLAITVPLFIFISFMLALFVSLLTLRYRDLQPLVQTTFSVMIFFTPVLWEVSQVSEKMQLYIVFPNFLYHYIELIRAPILGNSISSFSWIYLILFTIIISIVNIIIVNKNYKNIKFWI